uniref:Uncharacterized protein n=1 Tax=Oryza meridionalis TaxID=40149 RepID=A0A0E0EVA7_9ORYZ
MEELGINVVASTIRNVLSNCTSSGKAKKSVNKSSRRGEDSNYSPEDEEGVEGGGTYLDEEVLSITYPTSKQPRTKKPAIKKKLATKHTMPPGSTRSSSKASAPSDQPTGVETRSSKRQLSTEQVEDKQEQLLQGSENIDAPTARARRNPRPPTKGVMLDRMTGAMGRRLPIVVCEGMKRPEKPVQAAKLASEAGVIIRAEVPIFTHWKEYKDNGSHFNNFLGKLAGRLAVNKDDKATQNACTNVFQSGIRQNRYKLKHAYFNNVPANEIRITSPVHYMTDVQWTQLVAKWSDAKNKAISEKNKLNRARVRHHQAMGSCYYISHLYTYDNMENMMAEPVGDDDTPISSTEVVSMVLSLTSANNTFLKNASLETKAKKQGSAVLQEELHTLKKKSEETEKALAQTKDEMAKTQKELEEFKKKQ